MQRFIIFILLPLALLTPSVGYGASSEERARHAYVTWIATLYGTYPVHNVKTWDQLPIRTQEAWQRVVLTMCR